MIDRPSMSYGWIGDAAIRLDLRTIGWRCVITGAGLPVLLRFSRFPQLVEIKSKQKQIQGIFVSVYISCYQCLVCLCMGLI